MCIYSVYGNRRLGALESCTKAVSTLSERIRAARAVLGGADAEAVATSMTTDAELVASWAELYAEGGELALRLDPMSFDARDRFLPLVAHAFRTPLTVIGGWVELLQGDDLDGVDRAKALDVIARQVGVLERITSDALDAAAVARHQLELVIAPVDLRAILAATVAAAHDPLTTLVDGDPVEVRADADRLRRIAGNVLAHAQRLADGSPVAVSLSQSGDRVDVDMRIVGREILFETIAALFEPFDREDDSIGTGLGLFLARALVVAHDGEIGIRSDDDGTTFWYRLPVKGPEAIASR